MKTKYLLPILCSAALVAFNFRAVADGDDDGGTNECDIQGIEVMQGFVVLSPTANAPSNATGVAKIDSDNCNGNESGTIEVKTENLDPGDYTLSVTLDSTGSNVFVGDFTVSSNNQCGGQGDDQGDDDGGDQQDSLRFGDGGQWNGWGGFTNCFAFNGVTFTNCYSNWDNWCGFNNWGGWTNVPSGNCGGGDQGDDDGGDNYGCGGGNSDCGSNQPATVSHDRFDLPAGVNPTDIGAITVTDTNDNDILIGDVTNPAPATVINIQATVQLTPGAGGSMNGSVQLQSTAEHGKWKHHFNLQASDAASHSTYKMNVNGKAGAAGKSNKNGQLKITKLPSHVTALRSLKLLDSKGNEAASAHF